jgi:hypothetical protein
MKFGKHKNQTFTEIAAIDAPYFRWMLDQSDISEDVRFTIKQAMGAMF